MTKRSSVKKTEKPYLVSLKCGELEYTAEGDTLEEAFSALKAKQIKSKGYLTASKGKKNTQMILYPILARRFNANLIYRTILAKKMDLMLK